MTSLEFFVTVIEKLDSVYGIVRVGILTPLMVIVKVDKGGTGLIFVKTILEARIEMVRSWDGE